MCLLIYFNSIWSNFQFFYFFLYKTFIFCGNFQQRCLKRNSSQGWIKTWWAEGSSCSSSLSLSFDPVILDVNECVGKVWMTRSISDRKDFGTSIDRIIPIGLPHGIGIRLKHLCDFLSPYSFHLFSRKNGYFGTEIDWAQLGAILVQWIITGLDGFWRAHVALGWEYYLTLKRELQGETQTLILKHPNNFFNFNSFGTDIFVISKNWIF